MTKRDSVTVSQRRVTLYSQYFLVTPFASLLTAVANRVVVYMRVAAFICFCHHQEAMSKQTTIMKI